jgi:hypothetical protein
MNITSKQQMRELYNADAFGNRLKTFSIAQAADNLYNYPMGLMCNSRPGIQLPNYDKWCFDFVELFNVYMKWIELGINPNSITISETTFNAGGDIFQGEVMRTPEYIYLYYTTVSGSMRKALKQEGKHATGIIAVELLKYYMDSSSYDNLQQLWDEYPDSIIEFTVCRDSLGTQNLNTVFWEVRNY